MDEPIAPPPPSAHQPQPPDECGEDIAPQRLRALPFAVRCKDCEQARENAIQRERLQSQRSSSLFFDISG